MIIADPFSTSYGKLINKDRITKELAKHLIKSEGNLNYEYRNAESCKVIFITGWSEDEKSLPPFNQPIVFENLKHEKYVAVDLRKYVKTVTEEPESIDPIMKDTAACKNLIYSGQVIADFMSEDFGDYRKIYNNVCSAYAMFISYIVDLVIKLNPVEKFDIEVGASYFANLLLTPGKQVDDYLDAIIARMSNSKLSLPVSRKQISSIVSRLQDCNVTYDMEGLINIIKFMLPEEKSELVTENIIVSMLSNMWYGPGSNETMIMALECMPLWITLVYTCLTDNTYKRAKLSTIFDKYSKQVDSKEVIKHLDLVFKERRF